MQRRRPDPAAPLANRVDPFGDLFAAPVRGGMFGNRGGQFHDPLTQKAKRRRWASRQWICCVLEFKNRRREVWRRGYTDLFFLDEVTALAAGHRPCFECRRAEAVDFANCWATVVGLSRPPRAPEMDLILHAERLAPAKPGLSRQEVAALPDGTMISAAGIAYALKGANALQWQPAGYGSAIPRDEFASAGLLTPPAIVAVLRAGFRPRWPHQTPELNG